MTVLRHLLLALLSLCVALPGQSRTVRDFFASEPDNIFLLVPHTARLDLLDYHDNGQRVSMANRLGSGTQLVELDSTFLKIRTSESRTVELLVVPYSSHDTILAVIETVLTPVPDSRLRFFNSNWVELQSIRPLNPMPTIADLFLPQAGKAKRKELLDRLPFTLIEMTFTGERHDRLTVRHNLQQFLSKQEFAQFAPWLKSEINYSVGKKFKKI
ncbi:MAG: DUF3256 family protein [Muribaculaceae bacterium]|nr:DUF3256 family protein [Muribaculaceae bacterium]